MLEAAARRGRRRRRRRRAARRRAADARRAAAVAPLRLRPRGGALAPRTTRTRTTASSSSAPTATSSPTRPRREIEALLDGAGARRPRDRPRPRAARHAGGLPARAARRASPTLDLARPSTSLLDCANGATLPRRARDLPPPRRDGHRARRRARRAQHQRRLRLDARRRARRARSRAGGHDVGFAFDGDGDRVLAVDRDGAVVDGDELIALAALHLRAQRSPAGRRRRRDGDDELRLPHGDGGRPGSRSRPRRSATATCSRSCASAAGRSAASSPGTSSSSGFAPSGDGIASALLTLEALGRRATWPSATRCRSCPQRLVNVRVARPRRAAMAPRRAGRPRRARAASELAGRGRVLVRPSGTEPLVRVMVEAPSEDEADGGLRAPRRAGRRRRPGD